MVCLEESTCRSSSNAIFCLVSDVCGFKETFVYTHVLCLVVYSTSVVYFHTPLLCFAGPTLRALLQTCSDRAGCSFPFSSMNYRQRPRSPEPQQPTSQTQQKLTALVLFGNMPWIWLLSCVSHTTDSWVCPGCRHYAMKTSSGSIIKAEKNKEMSTMSHIIEIRKTLLQYFTLIDYRHTWTTRVGSLYA